MLNDIGINESYKTPSKTDSTYALAIANEWGISNDDISLHYVTRPYMTRHGRGPLSDERPRSLLSSSVEECRTNHYNIFQEEFRYAWLDIGLLAERIREDNVNDLKTEIELTHCDEMDRVSEFRKEFQQVNAYDSAFIK